VSAVQKVLTGRDFDPSPMIDEPVSGPAPADRWSDPRVGTAPLIDLPIAVTTFAWFLSFCDLVVTLWLFGVHNGSLGCSGTTCELATLSGHPRLTLALAAGSLVCLLALACLTEGFSRGSVGMLAVLGVTGLVAAAAVIGLVLVILVIVLVVGIVVLSLVSALAR